MVNFEAYYGIYAKGLETLRDAAFQHSPVCVNFGSMAQESLVLSVSRGYTRNSLLVSCRKPHLIIHNHTAHSKLSSKYVELNMIQNEKLRSPALILGAYIPP